MINPKELRLGNWIQFGARQVKCCHHDISNLCKMEATKQPSEEYQPIPLTNDILIRLGFELGTKYFFYYPKARKPFFLYKNGKDGPFFYCNFYTGGNKEITHVHQLQNFYFALFDEEL